MTTYSVTTAVAAAATAAFMVMDCPPSLFLFEKWCVWRDRAISRRLSPSENVWIVGASSGIGEELALQLADSGSCNSIILSARSKDKLEALSQVITTRHPTVKCQILPLDVCHDEDIESAVQKLSNVQLSKVFLNAGSGHQSPVLETSPGTARQLMEVNAIWPMILLPRLLETQEKFGEAPHVAVTCSIAAQLAVPLSAYYASAKAALFSYISTLRAECPHIRLDLICPGPVDTNFHRNDAGSSPGESGSTTKKPSPLKMPVTRCVRLMLASMQLAPRRQVWICPQPTLFLMYVNQWCPALVDWILSKVGSKRIEMWRKGLDLYDPASWRKA